MFPTAPRSIGLYDPDFEHDACGVGFVGRPDGPPPHYALSLGLSLSPSLAHPGASGADADSGDAAGVLLRIPDAIIRAYCDYYVPPACGHRLGLVV